MRSPADVVNRGVNGIFGADAMNSGGVNGGSGAGGVNDGVHGGGVNGGGVNGGSVNGGVNVGVNGGVNVDVSDGSSGVGGGWAGAIAGDNLAKVRRMRAGETPPRLEVSAYACIYINKSIYLSIYIYLSI